MLTECEDDEEGDSLPLDSAVVVIEEDGSVNVQCNVSLYRSRLMAIILRRMADECETALLQHPQGTA
jgi:hypothetical protein